MLLPNITPAIRAMIIVGFVSSWIASPKLSLIFGQQVASQSQNTTGELVPDVPVETVLRGGESSTHIVRLKAGRMLEIRIEKLGVEILARVRNPHKKLVIELNTPKGSYGPERLLVISQMSGSYSIEISATEKQGPGKLRLSAAVRRATLVDRDRIVAQKAFIEANTLAANTEQQTRERAILEYQKARNEFKYARDTEGEALVLATLGIECLAFADRQAALEALTQSGQLFKLAGDLVGETSTLEPLAQIYLDEAKYADSEQLERRLNDFYASTLPGSSLAGSARAHLADLCRLEGKYKEAESLYLETVSIMQSASEDGSAEFAQVLNGLGVVYYEEGKYDDAERQHNNSIKLRKQVLGPEAPLVAESLNNLAAVYWKKGNYAAVEPLLNEALQIQQKVKGENSDMAETLVNLCQLGVTQANYVKAEPYCKDSLTIFRRVLPPGHPNLGMVLNALAGVYRAQGKYDLAEPVYKESVEVLEKALGPNHLYTLEAISQFGVLYFDVGNYREAERIFREGLDRMADTANGNNPEVRLMLTNDLADVYSMEARYAEAEMLYRGAISAEEKRSPSDTPTLAVMLFNLAAVYEQGAKFDEAELLCKRALEIFKKSPGPETPEVATTSEQLAEIEYKRGDFVAAESDAKTSLEIRRKIQGEQHPDFAKSLNDLASVYWREGNLAQAQTLLEQALRVRQKALPPASPLVAQSLNTLARLYQDEGRYDAAETHYLEALRIRESLLGDQHPDTGNSLQNLAQFYFAKDQFVQADVFFDRALVNLKGQFSNQFAYMSEKERLSYLDTVSSFFPLYFSFCSEQSAHHPEVTRKMFNVVLWQKGLIVNSVALLRAKIAASGDQRAVALFEQLAAKRAMLASLQSPLPRASQRTRPIGKDLQQETNDIEALLTRRVNVLSDVTELSNTTWKDVKDKLSAGDAFVEFVRFPYSDGKKWTGKTYYAALLLRSEATGPSLVKLGEADKLDAGPLLEYKRVVGLEDQTATLGTRFYDAFWKPLESLLFNNRRIFLAPDGPLNEVVFDIVPTPGGGLLMDRYDLRMINSGRDLLSPSRPTPESTALLIGNPKFDLTSREQRLAIEKLRAQKTVEFRAFVDIDSSTINSNPRAAQRCLDLRPGDEICPLKGTGIEVENIYAELEKTNWRVDGPYVGENALEEVVKRAKHPRLLHIATHGFFFQDPALTLGDSTTTIRIDTSNPDPMLRSGLLFAGAGRKWKGESTPPDLDDGVLTAYEASTLDLQGTELVVLSACDTGRGDARAGEGVFGLRRALQEAGAESVMMSMWSVPNREKMELMTLFYENWLSRKMEKHEALRQAQLAERKTVRERCHREHCVAFQPFYWGAFVLVGP